MTAGKRVVNVINLGRMGYLRANDVQMRHARQHLDELAGKPSSKGTNVLLLVEHTPVYTVGIRNQQYSHEDAFRLKSLGAEYYKTNRGGLITFHGPGQLVAYPVLNLQHFQPSMKWYISALENTLIKTCQKFGITARTTADTGVWVEDRKIASIGVHGSRFVTTHGCSLNSNIDLNWYKHIVPCGLQGKEVTSLTKETGQEVPLSDAIGPFLSSFQEIFDCDLEYNLLEAHEMEELIANQHVLTQRMQNIQQCVRQMSTSAVHQPQAADPIIANPMW
ncbi:putative lipoyltransferase 2, mitochondrial [Patella vulgata]|uniref:putative lipoyltransferase 2, mitochondrial n=1 Tax=Patella vulgata TaxID=6465 RepID=UPI00217FF46E|nr:putative lipoyltransferase 2, mitochondrial [Patella vulgata]